MRQFEHNNFQEYLAAKVLSRQRLDKVREFISYPPEHKKIIPSWTNTLCFLVGFWQSKDLIEWIMGNEPELLVKFEAGRIDIRDRIGIFKTIFSDYKAKGIWINPDKFGYAELARFAQCDEIVLYLLAEIEDGEQQTTIGNAILILREMQIAATQRQRTTDALLRRAFASESIPQIQNRALTARATLRLNTAPVVQKVVAELGASENDWVRFGLYRFLYESDYLDDNIGVFLSGIKLIRNHHILGAAEPRVLDERWHLHRGLEEAKKPTAIKKILEYFAKNPDDLRRAYMESGVASLAKAAAVAFVDDQSIFGPAVALFAALVSGHCDDAANEFRSFFDKTESRLRAFEALTSERGWSRTDSLILAALADEQCLRFVVQQYKAGQVTDDGIWSFQSYLGWKNPDLYAPFNQMMNAASGNKFLIPPAIDGEKESARRKEDDIRLLLDSDAFLKEAQRIFDAEKKSALTQRELLEFETQNWQNPQFSQLVHSTLVTMAEKQAVSMDVVTKRLIGANWESFRVDELYRFLHNDKELVLPEAHTAWLTGWCQANLSKVDFRTALVTKANGTSTASTPAVYLWFFLRRLNLSYPKAVLLDMLSFDWIESHGMLGIEYLERLLAPADIRARIFENLAGAIASDAALENHFDYCRRHGVKECLPYALRIIQDTTRARQVREVALEAACELAPDTTSIEATLDKTADDFRWSVVEKLVGGRTEHLRDWLLKTLESGKDDERLKAAAHLIRFQDIRGLRYYTAWLKRNNRFPEDMFHKSPLLLLRTREAIPCLIELLELSYSPAFEQSDFERLDRVVLGSLKRIGAQDEDGYKAVKSTIQEFITENSAKLEHVNFLYLFLDDLEREYYMAKTQSVSIDQVIRKIRAVV